MKKNTIIHVLKCKPIWTHYFQVKQHYYKDLFSMITRDSKAAIPVLDPTQGKQPYKKTQIGFELPQIHNSVLQSCFPYLLEQILTMDVSNKNYGTWCIYMVCLDFILTAQHPPWRHWYNDVIPPFTKPQDRRKAREEREAERERWG